MDIRQITADYAVSPQIAPGDMALLASAGFHTIINNRPDGEEEGQPDNAALALAAEEAGLAYHFVPMIPGGLDQSIIAELGRLRNEVQGPVLAFCRTGTRSVTLWALTEKGKRASADILAAAERGGYDLSSIAPILKG